MARRPGGGRRCCTSYPAPAEGQPRAAARAPCGRRPGAAPAFPPGARGAASSPRCQRCRGAGTRRCGGRRRRGAGCCAGRTAGSRREREAGGGSGGRAAGWSESQPCSAQRPPEPRQEVSEWRESPGVPCRRPAPWPLSLPSSLLGSGFAPRNPAPVPGDAAQLAPRLQPPSRVGSGPAPHLLAPEPLYPGRLDLLGSVPRRRGVVRGFPAPAEASLGRCGAILFVLRLVTRVGI